MLQQSQNTSKIDANSIPDSIVSKPELFTLIESFVGHEEIYKTTDLDMLGEYTKNVTETFASEHKTYFEQETWPKELDLDEKKRLFQQYFLKTIQRFACNYFQFTVINDLQCRAAALYPMATLLNHSCDPNVDIIFSRNGLLEGRTVKRIEKSEELNNSYGPMVGHMRREMRQEKLKVNYFISLLLYLCSPMNYSMKVKMDITYLYSF